MDDPDGRRTRITGMAVAATICLAYLTIRPPSEDFASGHFRAELASRGVYLWNNLWFGGHPLPGYGVASPVLGAIFGVVPVAVVSVLVSTWCFILLVERWRQSNPGLPGPVPGVVLFACGCGVNLWGGRLTYLPAVMFGSIALLALQRKRRLVLVVSAALCGLSSPLGALSLVIIAVAAWHARSAERHLLVIIAVAALVPIGTLIVLFPESGWFPFTAASLALLAVALAAVFCCGRAVPLVRASVIVYGVVALGAFVVESPLGGNVVRLGWLLAGPAAALTIQRNRRTMIAVIVATSLIWNGAYIGMAFMPADRVASADYYDSLASYIDTLPQPLRAEVVPTATYGQADELALRINGIARGWETQLDRELNPEFYGDGLDAALYHQWLLEHAVSIVALPLGALRDISESEARVIRSHPSYLAPVWADQNWQVFRVVDPSPIADNDAVVVDVQPEELTIRATRTGWTIVKFRFTDLYQVSQGMACIESTVDGWIRLLVGRLGMIRLTISPSVDAVTNNHSECA